MADTIVEALIRDLLYWLMECDRSYEEVMDAWRTSCPRLTVWEDANDHGFIRREKVNGKWIIEVTSAGHAFMDRRAISAPNHGHGKLQIG